MKPLKLSLLIVFALNLSQIEAQKIKDETIEYMYAKLPVSPLNVAVKNYQAEIVAAYEADNRKKQAEHDANVKAAQEKYNAEMQRYPALRKQAEDSYAKALAEWNQKSVGQKLVNQELLGESKPVKQLPPEPYMDYVQPTELKTSYDYAVLAKTYLHLEGYNDNPNQALKIEVTLYGFDHTQPRQMSVQKDMMRSANGQTQTYKATYYYTEYSYRHPMSVKVKKADGSEVLTLTPQELNAYKIYRTPEMENPPPMNQEMLIKTSEENILQENLTFINNLLNDKYGYPKTPRKAVLYYVKPKDDTYTDLLVAYNNSAAGLRLLADDSSAANAKLSEAVNAWENAMKESDVNNKKARIDKNVTIAVCFDLLENYFALRRVQEAEGIFQKLNTMELSYSERKEKDAFEIAFNDLKKRLANNK